MKKTGIYFIAMLSSGILLLSSCSEDDSIIPDIPEKPVNSYLVEAQQAGTTSAPILALALSVAGYKEYAALLNSDVEALKVTYNTEYKGDKLEASGVFLVPDSCNPDYPTIIYTHGTITEAGAPSLNVPGLNAEIVLGMALASAFNCAVLMPDYIGYGVSASVPHPYIHAPSLAQASLDLIRAFKEYTADTENQLSFNNSIFIAGYSEGGYAAVALQKKIQETPTDLRVEKVVAGSGPYDNVTMAKECLKQTTELSTKFVSSYLWTLGMYKSDYGYSKNYDAIFSEADNAVLQEKGYDLAYSHTEELEINTNPALLFRQGFIDSVLNETDTEFLHILAENSLTNFHATDSLLLVYGTADDWVLPVNSINTHNAMSAECCKVMSYALPDGNHETTLPYFLDILLSRLQMIEFNN